MKKILLLLISLLIFLYSCKKETPQKGPEINIISPVKGEQVEVGLSFNVSGTVSDVDGINNIQVKLLDAELNHPYILASFQYNAQKNIDFQFPCRIDDPLLKSGDYWIRVTAINVASNLSNSFVEVHVKELEKKLEKVIFIGSNSPYTTNAYQWSGEGDVSLLASWNARFKKAALFSVYNQLYLIIEENNESLMAYDLKEDVEIFKIQPGMPYPVFTELKVDYPYVYYATQNGNIKGLNQLGLEKFNTLTNQDTFPNHVAFNESYILAACNTYVGNNEVLKVYYRESGSYIQRKVLDCNATDAEYADGYGFLLFANKDNHALVLHYDIELNWLDEIMASEMKLQDVVPMNGSDYILKLNDDWYQYEAGSNDLHPLNFLDGSAHLKYESLNHKVYEYQAGLLKIFDMESQQLVNSLQLTDSIADIQFWYNK